MVAIEKVKTKVRAVNPHRPAKKHRKKNSARPASAARSITRQNPVGGVITLGLVNPQEGRTMAKKATKNGAKTASHKKAARKSNPVVIIPAGHAARPNGKRRKKRNPDGFPPAKRAAEMIGFALASLVATRQVPQWLLGVKNTGVLGYFSNIVTTLLGTWGAAKAAGPDAALGAFIGGNMYTASRGLIEYVSPVGRYLTLSGVGDAAAASKLAGVPLRQGYFPVPVQFRNGQPVIPQAIVDAVRASLPAAPAPTPISGVARAMGRKF